MSLQSSLIRRGTASSVSQRLDLEKEDEIIKITDCNLDEATERFKKTLIGRFLHLGGRSVEAMIGFLPVLVSGTTKAERFQFNFDKEEDLLMVLNKLPCHFNHWIFALERWEPFTSENFPNTVPFWIKVTGVLVHFWNDKTFGEIAKALGKKMAIDANNAHFQRRVGFPNGDIGKVTFSYEGLDRYCFGCKRISHDIYACTEISQGEKEQLIKEYRELNSAASSTQQCLLGPPGNRRSNNGNNKRPRSPTSDMYRGSRNQSQILGISRGEKRNKASENYWTSRSSRDNGKPVKESDWSRDEKYDHHQELKQKDNVWSRLDKQTTRKKTGDYNSRHDLRNQAQGSQGRLRGMTRMCRVTVWCPKSQLNGEKSNNHSRTVTNSNRPGKSPSEKKDSQQTISGVIPVHIGLNGQDKRMRLLKGKAHMTAESQEKHIPHALWLKDRGTNMEMTREEENEVDKLVDEFGDVVMDDNMVQNDNLIVDEPGYNAEIIDSISQLSPENAEFLNMQEEARYSAMGETIPTVSAFKTQKQPLTDQKKKKSSGKDRSTQVGKQSGLPSGAVMRKKIHRIPDLKGVCASKKLNAIRGKPSPKNNPRGSGSVGSQKPPSKKI
ncbi:hypothetical protein N665_0008s0275 [Sinapis alba]|nr:hypothetical protein N665_0008s0275 [Sinapis alba]